MSLPNRPRLTRLAGSFALALTLLGAPMAGADGLTGVNRVALSAEQGRTVVVVETDAAAGRPQTFFLAGPDRFVVDIPQARWALEGHSAGQGPGAGSAARYRFANRPDGA